MLGPEVTKSADDSPRKRAKMIFEKMDVNQDKELTLKEFVDGCLADKELFQVGDWSSTTGGGGGRVSEHV